MDEVQGNRVAAEQADPAVHDLIRLLEQFFQTILADDLEQAAA